MKKSWIFAIACIALLALFAAASVYFEGRKAREMEAASLGDASLFNREHSQSLGEAEARVVITEFLDPGCETCRAMHPFLKQLLAARPGRIRLVIRYVPLHHGSDDMAKILEASREQGKYWETLEVMYESQPHWASHSDPQPQKIWQFLPRAGLDIDRIKKDMLKPGVQEVIAQDMADARALNVTKTPGFFVNGRPLVKFGYEELLQLVQSEYDRHYQD